MDFLITTFYLNPAPPYLRLLLDLHISRSSPIISFFLGGTLIQLFFSRLPLLVGRLSLLPKLQISGERILGQLLNIWKMYTQGQLPRQNVTTMVNKGTSSMDFAEKVLTYLLFSDEPFNLEEARQTKFFFF